MTPPIDEKNYGAAPQKSREMKTRLIEATLTCLQERGYHGTSISQILSRAGVSRGAWRHHYETKNDLVAAASEFLLSTAVKRAHDIAPQISETSLNIEEILAYIW